MTDHGSPADTLAADALAADPGALDVDAAVAIIGMAGRFPGAGSVAELWANVCAGTESISRWSDEQLIEEGVPPEDLRNPKYVKANAALDDIESFDARFFGYTPREAQIMDPQQRIFLEACWSALEDASCDPDRFEGSIGTFAGSGLSTYFINNLLSHPTLQDEIGPIQLALSNDKDSLCTRVAYCFNLTGPAVTVQTYCSTSLVAVCQAATSLVSGECDVALAGGVAVSVPQRSGYLYQPGGILSPDGSCRPFDAEAGGAPLGSGVAVVVLKRLAEAIADGDHLYAVVRGWATNNDGALKVGYSAPGVRGQSEVIAEAIANAGVGPETIGYVEAHGTGTPLGDAVEVAALRLAIPARAGGARCALGSIKSNVGHLDRAAGVTGLIKAALAVHHGRIPATLHCRQPNPDLKLDDSAFSVATESQAWTERGPRRAGVSAFGIGGTNAHVVIEEPPVLPGPPPPARGEHLLVLSARSQGAAARRAADLADHLAADPRPDLADVAQTLQVGRRHFVHRHAVVSAGGGDAAGQLRSLAGRPATEAIEGRPVAFLLPGAQADVGVTAPLYALEPVFRAAVDRAALLLVDQGAIDFRPVLVGGRDAPEATPVVVQQVGSFVTTFALAELLKSWGVRPDALLGYGLGGYTAGCLAGALSLEDATVLLAAWAQEMNRLPAGAMLAVALAPEAVDPLLPAGVEIAAVDGPDLVVVAGPPEPVRELQARLAERGVPTWDTGAPAAFHTSHLRMHADRVTAAIAGRLALRPPTVRCVSSLTGTWLTPEEAADPAYWASEACRPTHFAAALETLVGGEPWALLELAGSNLTALARQRAGRAAGAAAAPLVAVSTVAGAPSASPATRLLASVGELWCAGVDLDWDAVERRSGRRVVPLPTYPFERARHWIEPRTRSTNGSSAGPAPALEPSLLVPTWHPEELAPAAPAVPGPVLVFEDDAGVGEALIGLLDRAGVPSVGVRAGSELRRSGDARYTVRPGEAADHRRLCEALGEAGLLPASVVHLWGVSPAAAPRGSFEQAQQRGFLSLVALAPALGDSARGPVRLAMVTDGVHPVTGSESIEPAKATALGATAVLPQEHPMLRCSNIDIALDPGRPAAAGEVAELLLRELSPADGSPVIAYRDGRRFVRRFTPAPAPASTSPRPAVRPEGVYLITGGLGPVGLLLAEHLASVPGVRLVLTTRRPLPPPAQWRAVAASPGAPLGPMLGRLAALQDRGARLLVVTADVTDEAAMTAMLAEVHRSFGRLNGVIHAAGITDVASFHTLRDTSPQAWAAQRAPKVEGLEVLSRTVVDEPLDFCVLQSSVAAFLGGVGFAAYAAANNYMDSFVHRRRQQPGGDAWVSVNWDTWEVTAEGIRRGGFGASMADHRMTADQAVAAFEHVVAHPHPQVVVAVGDLEARAALWSAAGGESPEPGAGSGAATTFPRPALSTAMVVPETGVQQDLAALWASALGVQPIGIDDDFFELGGNSLTGMQLLHRINVGLAANVMPEQLFECPTIRKLAELVGQQGPAGDVHHKEAGV